MKSFFLQPVSKVPEALTRTARAVSISEGFLKALSQVCPILKAILKGSLPLHYRRATALNADRYSLIKM